MIAHSVPHVSPLSSLPSGLWAAFSGLGMEMLLSCTPRIVVACSLQCGLFQERWSCLCEHRSSGPKVSHVPLEWWHVRMSMHDSDLVRELQGFELPSPWSWVRMIPASI